ncbi:hypothetical protein [Flavobacterium sp. HNIBRBA15423]|uniref:hypothetical protein n=1 Tax=Flavobacterium sp. HNIBRBA15423 TaxID=3458683 RepID=UPI0040450A6B
MKKSTPKRTLHFYLILCSMALLTIISCAFTNKEEEDSLMTYINGNIYEYKNNNYEYKNIEAELLAKFNEKKLNLITISAKEKEKEIPFRVKCLATNLIEEQSKINETINEITSKKLIIIPCINIQNNCIQLDDEDDNDIFRNKYLETVSNILKSQIQDLTLLSQTTKDIDFKILAIQTIAKLNTSLNEVKQIITVKT